MLGTYWWRKIQKQGIDTHQKSRLLRYLPKISAIFLAIISFIGLILELSGFGELAKFWFISWGKSVGILIWILLLIRIVNEVDRLLRNRNKEEVEGLNLATYQFQWLGIRLLQVAVPIIFGLALILAWGGRQAIWNNAYLVLSYQFQVGDMKFSLLSLLQAILVLICTYMVTRLWRYFFQKRFLDHSRIELGLQDSITTITVYAIWAIGTMISLNVFGLNPTSLVVVFGALGIGLGFGLQNIFNNFMSGLILLFERPIQVGDDIEVSGIWATVRKINVRSTLVQTYDNASLIIPNSDLINNQVTNWSFKDKRLRRQISVGVAYGSDIELVRDTLLEICDNVKNVLRYPKPDVLFVDFGDSALIFKIRFWTHIHCIFETDTNVRFEIDRMFRERNITIAFPQRDVHVFYENNDKDRDESETDS